jgi:hypothetical protein
MARGNLLSFVLVILAYFQAVFKPLSGICIYKWSGFLMGIYSAATFTGCGLFFPLSYIPSLSAIPPRGLRGKGGGRNLTWLGLLGRICSLRINESETWSHFDSYKSKYLAFSVPKTCTVKNYVFTFVELSLPYSHRFLLILVSFLRAWKNQNLYCCRR